MSTSSNDRPRIDLLPVAPPSKRTPARMAQVTVALGSGVFAAVLYGVIPYFDTDRVGLVLMTVATMIVGAVATRKVFDFGGDSFLTIVAGAISGVLLGGAFTFSHVILERRPEDYRQVLGPLVLFGTVGVLVGTLFSATALFVILPAAGAEKSDSLDRLDRATLPAGMWLVVIAGLGLVAAPKLEVASRAVELASGIVALVALEALVLVAVRDHRRSKWVARLLRGELPALRITPGRGDATPLFGTYREEEADGRITPAPGPETPYRTARQEDPEGPPNALARLPMDLAAARRPFRRRQWIAISTLVLAIAALSRLHPPPGW